MDSGYYAACAGLRAQTQALELVANNLANLNTAGFRAQHATFRTVLAGAEGSFNPLNRAVNDFGVLSGTRLDANAGNLERTANPLDFAIEGPGFFEVQTASGSLYTRNGGFQISRQGELITPQGDRVLGMQGPLRMPQGKVTLGSDGTISVNGAVAGRLRVVEFDSQSQLEPAGNSYYAAPKGAAASPATGSYVRQGMIESSNVNAVAAATGLIAVQRHAEMLQRALSLFHSEFNRIAAGELPRV